MPGFIRVSWPGFIQLWYYSVITDYLLFLRKKRVGGVVEEDISNDSWRSGGHHWHATFKCMSSCKCLFRLEKNNPHSQLRQLPDTVLPFSSLAQDELASLASVRTQHLPTCSHSQNSGVQEWSPCSEGNRDMDGETAPWQPSYPGLPAMPAAQLISLFTSTSRNNHASRDSSQCLLIQKQVYFPCSAPQRGAEDTHVNKIPARVHKPEGERDTATNICTDDNMVNTFPDASGPIWAGARGHWAAYGRMRRLSFGGTVQVDLNYRFCQVEMVAERAWE